MLFVEIVVQFLLLIHHFLCTTRSKYFFCDLNMKCHDLVNTFSAGVLSTLKNHYLYYLPHYHLHPAERPFSFLVPSATESLAFALLDKLKSSPKRASVSQQR